MRRPDVSTLLGRFLRQYFLQHLKIERRVSDNTIVSYASTFRLLISFCLGRRKRRASSLEISDLDVDTILAFLRHLEAERGSGPLTRKPTLAFILELLASRR